MDSNGPHSYLLNDLLSFSLAQKHAPCLSGDLKVLVRSFNCESHACSVGDPRDFFLRAHEGIVFIRASFEKVGYNES